MSRETKRSLGLLALMGTILPLCVLAFTMGFRTPENISEVTLIAKEMAFYVEGSKQPNPSLLFPAGKKIRIRFINKDAGMLHDLLFSDFGVATGIIRYGEEATVEFRPKHLKESEYLCTFHPVAMRGKLSIVGDFASP